MGPEQYVEHNRKSAGVKSHLRSQRHAYDRKYQIAAVGIDDRQFFNSIDQADSLKDLCGEDKSKVDQSRENHCQPESLQPFLRQFDLKRHDDQTGLQHIQTELGQLAPVSLFQETDPDRPPSDRRNDHHGEQFTH